MKKKITDEEIGEVIGKLADQIRSEMDYDFRVAQSQMWIAEKDFIDTLDENQVVLYNKYVEKRKVVHDLVSEMYVKKI